MTSARGNRDDRAPTWPPGWSVNRVTETGSTNTDLIAAAGAGAPDRSVLVADHQTLGKGRLDRRWETPPGSNLLVSILFRQVPDPPVELTHRVGIAAVAAVDEIAGVTARLKWPNDLLVDDRKLAGILAQRAADGSVVVGLGLNVGWAPEGAASLGDGHRPLVVLASLLRHLDQLPHDIRDRYRSLLVTLGQRVRVETGRETVAGTAIDVDTQGRLVVIDECGLSHRLEVGDVVHLRPSS